MIQESRKNIQLTEKEKEYINTSCQYPYSALKAIYKTKENIEKIDLLRKPKGQYIIKFKDGSEKTRKMY